MQVLQQDFEHILRKVLFWDESGHEPQLRAVHADGATAKSAKMGGEARPSGSGVGLMHRLPLTHSCRLRGSELAMAAKSQHQHLPPRVKAYKRLYIRVWWENDCKAPNCPCCCNPYR